MSVTDVVQVQFRRFNGYNDPRLPEAQWMVHETLTGDASAGSLTIIMQFASAESPLDSRVYSLDQVAVMSGNTSTAIMHLQTLNMDDILGAAPLPRWAFTTVADGVGTTCMAVQDAKAFRGIFLGRQRLPGSISRLDLITPNVDTFTVEVYAMGYAWGPRSVLADGGPQRPLSGLLGP